MACIFGGAHEVENKESDSSESCSGVTILDISDLPSVSCIWDRHVTYSLLSISAV